MTYIKRIIIKGFKTFNDATLVGEFSRTCNCVLGLNGSGKSSFFSAFEFILSPLYFNVNLKEKADILYNGYDSSDNGFVEIVFDNSSGLFPIEREEISIRRSIGFQKDEYFINKKHVTKNEVSSLFDSAGIPVESNIYIIKQGKVKVVSEMSDFERLNLLFEVSGFMLYNQKREDALYQLAESNTRREKILKSIDYIESKLVKLSEEVEVLDTYEELLNHKSAIQYLIYNSDLENNLNEYQEINNQLMSEKLVLDSLYDMLYQSEQKLSQIENETHVLKYDLNNIESKIESMNNMYNKRKKEASISRIKESELRKRIDTSKRKYNEAVNDSEHLNINKHKTKQKIIEITKNIKLLENNMLEINNALGNKDREYYTNLLQNLSSQKDKLSSSIESLKKSLSEKEELLSDNMSCLKELEILNIKTEKKLNELNQEINKMLNNRKELWYSENNICKLIEKCNSSYEKYKKKSKYTYRRIDEIFDSSNQMGIYGPLIELISFDQDLSAAIEAVSKKKLNYYIAENEKIVKKYLSEFDFPVSFILLNHIKLHSKVDISGYKGLDYLSTFVSCEEKFKLVVDHIFGDFLLCPTFSLACEVSDTCRVKTVTVSGEICYPNGLIIGGYMDPKTSLIESSRKIIYLENLICENKNIYNAIKEQISELDHNIENSRNEYSAIESNIYEHNHKISTIKTQNTSLKNEIDIIKERIELQTNELDCLLLDINLYSKNIDCSSNMVNESKKLELKDKLKQMQSSLFHQNLELGSLNIHYNEIITKLDMTHRILNDIDNIDQLENELEYHVKNSIIDHEFFTYELNTLESLKIEREKCLSDTLARIAITKNEEREINDRVKYQQTILDEFNRKLLLLDKQLKLSKNNICQISPIPHEEIHFYQNLTNFEMIQRLKTVNDSIKTYKYVNRKAKINYTFVKNQLDMLKTRLNELEEGRKKLISMIDELDSKRNMAFDVFFCNVSSEFSAIYKSLSGNDGSLIILKENIDDDMLFSNDQEIKGIGVRITYFNQMEMSGGQKTLIALSILLAIQQVQPSPIFIMDEVDSDLDNDNTIALSNLLKTYIQTPDSPQFFISTFKRDIVDISDITYGIKYNASGSRISELSQLQIDNFFDEIHDNSNYNT